MDKDLARGLSTCTEKYKDVRLLLLFGSQSRGQARDTSDWDFGYIAHPDFDSGPLYTDLVLTLGTDKVDLVDLSRASGLLRFRAARDGIPITEASKKEYLKFWQEAVDFWCDVAPLIRNEYKAILESLG